MWLKLRVELFHNWSMIVQYTIQFLYCFSTFLWKYRNATKLNYGVLIYCRLCCFNCTVMRNRCTINDTKILTSCQFLKDTFNVSCSSTLLLNFKRIMARVLVPWRQNKEEKKLKSFRQCTTVTHTYISITGTAHSVERTDCHRGSLHFGPIIDCLDGGFHFERRLPLKGHSV